MWGHYLLTLYRSLMRHKLYAALNVLGLAVGIAVFLTLALFVRFESRFEQWIPEASKISIVRETWTLPGLPREPSNGTPGVLLEALKADYPQLQGLRLRRDAVVVRKGGQSAADYLTFADANVFDMFRLPLVEGDPGAVLRDTSSLVLTRRAAHRYFGNADSLGRTLTISVLGQPHTYRVTGVLKDLPPDTDLKIEMLALLAPAWFDKYYFHDWGNGSARTYLKFGTPEQARQLEGEFDRFVDRHAVGDFGAKPAPDTFFHLSLTPLPRLHLSDPRDAATVATLGAVGVLTLLIAALNYMNLATAQAGLRAREVAVRKALGATRGALKAQFLSEAVATVALAALLGLVLCELGLPLVNAAGGVSLRLAYVGSDGVLPIIAALVALVGVGAGLYPAVVLSQFQPAAVLASARAPGGGRSGARVRELLVLAQFSIATGFIICAGVLFAQTRHLQTADLGFHRNGLILVSSFEHGELTGAQRILLLDAFRGVPGVASVTQSDTAPGDDDNNSRDVLREGQKGDRAPSITWAVTGPDYFTTYGARLLAGRWLDRDHGLDDFAGRPTASEHDGDVVLNAAAVKVLGFASPTDAVGKALLRRVHGGGWKRMPVVGVVADMRFHSPHEQIRPTMYRFSAQDLASIDPTMNRPVAALRYVGADPREVGARLQTRWRAIAPGVPFQANTAQARLDDYYVPDQQRARLFTLGAALAVAIGCVGLYGLASFTTARRVKEIGIRKTLGASTRDVLALLVGQFLRPVLLANVVAWPLAWLAMQRWLSGFDQRISLGPPYFLAAAALSLGIAVVTVAGQALAVARAEPAKALRHE
ncbi:MAG: FtsX-like permease family protein [Caulobacteraceae bacterium]